MPEMEGKVDYREIDISEDRAAMSKYNIQATPTIIILDGSGAISDTFVGVPGKAGLESALEKVSPG